MYLQNILKRISLALFVVVVIGYTGYKLIPMISGPDIIIDTIDSKEDQNIFTVSGRVLRANELRVFDRTIKVDEKGNWKETLVKHKPYTEVIFIATDKWGKITTENIMVR